MMITSQRIDETGRHVVEFDDTGMYATSTDGVSWTLYQTVRNAKDMVLAAEVHGTDKLCDVADAYL